MFAHLFPCASHALTPAEPGSFCLHQSSWSCLRWVSFLAFDVRSHRLACAWYPEQVVWNWKWARLTWRLSCIWMHLELFSRLRNHFARRKSMNWHVDMQYVHADYALNASKVWTILVSSTCGAPWVEGQKIDWFSFGRLRRFSRWQPELSLVVSFLKWEMQDETMFKGTPVSWNIETTSGNHCFFGWIRNMLAFVERCFMIFQMDGGTSTILRNIELCHQYPRWLTKLTVRNECLRLPASKSKVRTRRRLLDWNSESGDWP